MKNDIIRQGNCFTCGEWCTCVANSESLYRPDTIYCSWCAKPQTVRDLYPGEEVMGHPIDGDFACDCESCQRRGKSLVQNYLLRKSSSAQRDLYSGEEAMPSIDGDKDPVEDYHTLVRDFSNGDKTMANFEPMFGATDVGNPMDKQSYRAAMVIGPTKEQELAELVKTKDAEIVTLQHTKGYLKIAIFMMAIVAVVSSTAILMLK